MQMLQRVGFRDIRVVGRVTGTVRRIWSPFDRLVIHATK
jgi:hypothetical protein